MSDNVKLWSHLNAYFSIECTWNFIYTHLSSLTLVKKQVHRERLNRIVTIATFLRLNVFPPYLRMCAVQTIERMTECDTQLKWMAVLLIIFGFHLISYDAYVLAMLISRWYRSVWHTFTFTCILPNTNQTHHDTL